MRKSRLALHEPPAWPQSLDYDGETIKVIGRMHFLVKSKTEGGWHVVDLEPIIGYTQTGREFVDFDPGCSCTSWRVRGYCRHVEKVRALCGLDEPREAL